MNATLAAKAAGYTPASARNAGYRLLRQPAIVRRILELQQETAATHCRDVDVLLGKLETIYRRAVDDRQLAAAARAVELQAKLSGIATAATSSRMPDFSTPDFSTLGVHPAAAPAPETRAVDTGGSGCERKPMLTTTPATVARLCRYPVKGLSAQPLERADLLPGRGMPLDRAFALAYTTISHPADGSQWMPKKSFATLDRHERLAALDVQYDEKTKVVTVLRNGKRVARGAVGTPIGRAMIEEFFGAYLKRELAGPMRFVGSADGPPLADHPEPAIALVGLSSIADIERVAGCPVDPLRFRANVYLQGTPPWAEFGWIGHDIRLGTARLRVSQAITCSAAINVEPGTGMHDLSLLQDLKRGLQHTECGVLAQVIEAGSVAVGDPIEVPAEADATTED